VIQNLFFFVSGQLSPVEAQPLIPLAAAGEIVDVSVQLRMPDKPGRYTGYYRLSHGDGVRFGNRIWLDVLVSDSVLPDVKGVFDKAIEAVSKVFRGEKAGQSEPQKQDQKKQGEQQKTEELAFQFENELRQLKEMGFSDEKQIKQLLLKFKGNVQMVANRLL